MAPVSLIFLSVPVSSCASAGPAVKAVTTTTESSIFRRIEVLSSELAYPSVRPHAGVQPSIPDFNIASGCVLQRRKLSAAGLAGRHLGRILLPDPIEPMRPPGSRVLLGLCQPFVEVGAGRFGSGPILILHLVGGIDNAGDVSRAGEH